MDPRIDKDRLRMLEVSIDDIGKEVMFCPKCLFQGQSGYAIPNTCPYCKRGLYISIITNDLINLIDTNEEIK